MQIALIENKIINKCYHIYYPTGYFLMVTLNIFSFSVRQLKLREVRWCEQPQHTSKEQGQDLFLGFLSLYHHSTVFSLSIVVCS